MSPVDVFWSICPIVSRLAAHGFKGFFQKLRHV
jgi:hypothetical protein